MRKIKAINSYRGNSVDSDIQEWIKDAGNIEIISVSGSTDKEYYISYILYETEPKGMMLS